MNSEAGGCLIFGLALILVVVLMVGVFSFFGNIDLNGELRQRGLKEYDKQTGRLIWTEKAGGEKGGDK